MVSQEKEGSEKNEAKGGFFTGSTKRCEFCGIKVGSKLSFCGVCGITLDKPVFGKERGLGRAASIIVVFVGIGMAGLLIQNFLLLRKLDALHAGQRIIVGSMQSASSGSTAGHDHEMVEPASSVAGILFTALRDPCDANKLLADSSCKEGKANKRLINRMLAEGKTKKQVFTYFLDRYGEAILSLQAQSIRRSRTAPN